MVGTFLQLCLKWSICVKITCSPPFFTVQYYNKSERSPFPIVIWIVAFVILSIIMYSAIRILKWDSRLLFSSALHTFRESPKKKMCVMPYVCKNRCAYAAHMNLRNIKRAQQHFPFSEEDVWLDAWRGGMFERDLDGEVSIDVKSSHLFRCN